MSDCQQRVSRGSGHHAGATVYTAGYPKEAANGLLYRSLENSLGSQFRKRATGIQAFQDNIQRNYCWGCGSINEHGLQIKSYWSGDESVCTWQPKPYHAAGPLHVLNGGIIATIIDCHSVCTAIAAAYRAEGREIGTEPPIWYVTKSLQIAYLRPTPIDQPLVLRARIKGMNERTTTLTCSLLGKGEECARGEVVAVRVASAWLEATMQEGQIVSVDHHCHTE